MTGRSSIKRYITGYHDSAYFLSYVDDKAKKIAYAGSFGRTDFTKAILKEYAQMPVSCNYC